MNVRFSLERAEGGTRMQGGNVAKRLLSWRVIAAILAGMLAGSIIMTPVGAHVTTGVKHLINKHLKKTFYTKKLSDARYVRKTDSTTVAGFKNGPGDVPSVPSVTDAAATIATLAVPAGNFAILAKLYVEDPTAGPVDPDITVVCRLEAGTDFDESSTELLPPWRDSLSLQVVHAFTAAGSAVVKCRDDQPAPNTTTVFRYLKILAIEQGSVSNVALP
jgi:hypothetical protein